MLQGDDSISRTHAQATVPDGDSNSIQITGDIRHIAGLVHCICCFSNLDVHFWPLTLQCGSSDL